MLWLSGKLTQMEEAEEKAKKENSTLSLEERERIIPVANQRNN